MSSRREFLTAGSMAGTLLSAGPTGTVKSGESNTSAERPAARDYWNDLPNFMASKIGRARTQRKSEIAKVKSSADGDARSALIRERVWECIGGRPEATPLNARVTGVVDRESYRVEKVVFESQPEFYVTSHLYLPKSGSKPFPAIIAPVGHAQEGKTYRSYQTLFQNLARKGFMVLTWDPPGQGERLQYLDPRTNKSPYGPTGEHDRFGWPALLIGSSTTQFEVWDGIQALQYLLSRPEVNAGKIGCCGHSGGGTQSMFLCALEPRIKAAVVVEGHTENVAGANYEAPGAYADAEQNIIGGLKYPIDRGDLLAAFAPKPLRICYTPIDNGTTYSSNYVKGTHEIFSELESLYQLYGAKNRVALFSSTLPHDYDFFHRTATYEWFNMWLLDGHGDAEETDFQDAPEATLWCTTTGQVLSSLGGRTAVEVNTNRLRTLRSSADRTGFDSERIPTELREILSLHDLPRNVRGHSLSSKTYKDIAIEEIEYESQPGIRIPGWFLKPAVGTAKFPVVLMTEENGRDGLFDQWLLVEQLARAGVAICSIDLRTCGVTRPRLPSAGPLFSGYGVELAYSLVNLSLGTPIIGQQTSDIISGIEFLKARNDMDGNRIALFGSGTTGLPCIMAAALDKRIRSLLLDRTLVSFDSIVSSKDYDLPLSAVAFGILRKLDLPELCASLAPRSAWLLNTVGPNGNPLPLSTVTDLYQAARRVYEHARAGEKLCFRVEPDPLDNVVLEWARKSFE